jgi:hypothetical protein
LRVDGIKNEFSLNDVLVAMQLGLRNNRGYSAVPGVLPIENHWIQGDWFIKRAEGTEYCDRPLVTWTDFIDERHEIDGRRVLRPLLAKKSYDWEAPRFGNARAKRGRCLFIARARRGTRSAEVFRAMI